MAISARSLALFVPTLVLVPALARADVPHVPRMLACDNTLEHVLPAQTFASELTMRDGAVVFAVTQLQPVYAAAVHVLDVATNVVTPLSGFSAAHRDFAPELVTDDFLVYSRLVIPSGPEELHARWRGADLAWATADDVDWIVDTTASGSATAGILPAHANDGELAYVYYDPTLSIDEVRHCEFVPTSARACLPGLVAAEPVATSGTAHPIFGGTTLLDEFGGPTRWIDPGQPAQPWSNDILLDTHGALVATRDAAGDLVIHLAVLPSLPLWTIATYTWAARIAPTPGSNANVRVAWSDASTLAGYVADLGSATPGLGVLTYPADHVAPDGDDIAYVKVPLSPPYWSNVLEIDTCVF